MPPTSFSRGLGLAPVYFVMLAMLSLYYDHPSFRLMIHGNNNVLLLVHTSCHRFRMVWLGRKYLKQPLGVAERRRDHLLEFWIHLQPLLAVIPGWNQHDTCTIAARKSGILSHLEWFLGRLRLQFLRGCVASQRHACDLELCPNH